MLELLLTATIGTQSLIIVVASIYVLQRVLNQCSKILRLAFVTFPIAASIEFVEMLYHKNVHLNLVLFNIAIMMLLYWLWNQKKMFLDLEQLMRNKELNKPYSFVAEIKAMVSCFAIWVLRSINSNLEHRCVVCEQILPK